MNNPDSQRLHALDAVRGFALLLGVAFHAALSFIPGLPPGFWAMNDNSPSPFLADASFVSHVFRMSVFFFIAGFFARLMHQKLGTGGFWKNRLMRIALPLVIFWVLLTPVIGFVWTLGLTKVFGGAPPAMPPMPDIPGFFLLTHLWFLYYLLILYVATLAIRAVLVRLDAGQKLRGLIDRMVAGSLRLPFAVFVLGIPLAAAIIAIPVYFYGQGIPTPDMSLFPQLPATLGYGTAFVFGWMVHRSSGALAAITQRWWLHLAIGIAATAYLLQVLHASPMAQPGFTKNAFAYAYGVAVWGWALGLTGAALRFLSGFSATRRYIADASYWVYIVHLPVVAAHAGVGGPVEPALEPQVPVHPDRELRVPVRNLSLAGPLHRHRPVAQRTQVSAGRRIRSAGDAALTRFSAAAPRRWRRPGGRTARHHQEVRQRHGAQWHRHPGAQW